MVFVEAARADVGLVEVIVPGWLQRSEVERGHLVAVGIGWSQSDFPASASVAARRFAAEEQPVAGRVVPAYVVDCVPVVWPEDAADLLALEGVAAVAAAAEAFVTGWEVAALSYERVATG